METHSRDYHNSPRIHEAIIAYFSADGIQATQIRADLRQYSVAAKNTRADILETANALHLFLEGPANYAKEILDDIDVLVQNILGYPPTFIEPVKEIHAKSKVLQMNKITKAV